MFFVKNFKVDSFYVHKSINNIDQIKKEKFFSITTKVLVVNLYDIFEEIKRHYIEVRQKGFNEFIRKFKWIVTEIINLFLFFFLYHH